MKTTTTHLALAFLAGGIALAQDGPGKGRPNRRPPPVPPLLAFFDSNHDGKLSDDEVKNAAAKLGELDQNQDGEITVEEIRPPRPPEGEPPQGPPPHGGKMPPPPIVAALDTDKDGTISAEEMEDAPESLKELDKNGDGKLTPEEIHHRGPPPPPPGEGGRRRPQGQPPEGGGDGYQ